MNRHPRRNRSRRDDDLSSVVRIILQLVQLATILAVISYGLGRFYIEAYYHDAGLGPSSLAFSNQDYMFASLEMVIVSILTVGGGLAISKFQLITLLTKQNDTELKQWVMKSGFPLVFYTLFFVFLLTVLVVSQPSSRTFPGIWGISTGLLLIITASITVIVAPPSLAGLLFILILLVRPRLWRHVIKVVWHALLLPSLASLAGLFYRKSEGWAKARSTQPHRMRVWFRYGSIRAEGSREIVRSSTVDYYGVLSRWSHNRFAPYLTSGLIVMIVVTLLPFLTQNLASRDFREDVQGRTPITYIVHEDFDLADVQVSLGRELLVSVLLEGCDRPVLSDGRYRIILERDDVLFAIHAGEAEYRSCLRDSIEKIQVEPARSDLIEAYDGLVDQYPLLAVSIHHDRIKSRAQVSDY